MTNWGRLQKFVTPLFSYSSPCARLPKRLIKSEACTHKNLQQATTLKSEFGEKQKSKLSKEMTESGSQRSNLQYLKLLQVLCQRKEPGMPNHDSSWGSASRVSPNPHQSHTMWGKKQIRIQDEEILRGATSKKQVRTVPKTPLDLWLSLSWNWH